jgi:hypothetical protein
VEIIRNHLCHGGFKTDDEHEHNLHEKPLDFLIVYHWIYVDSHFDVTEIQTEEEICNTIMNPQTITDNEEENSETSLALSSSKEIVKALSFLRKETFQHRADEKVFEQHYSYENLVMELLDAKKQTSIDTYFN